MRRSIEAAMMLARRQALVGGSTSKSEYSAIEHSHVRRAPDDIDGSENALVLQSASGFRSQWRLLCLAIVLTSICLLPACQRRERLRNVEYPETGYVFPAVWEISEIEFQGRGWGYLPDFSVAETSWNALLEALSPSQRAQRLPWVVIGVLRITTKAKTEHWVDLYLIGEPGEVGAFSAGPRDNPQQTFRGGSSERLERALKDAYKEFRGSEKGSAK